MFKYRLNLCILMLAVLFLPTGLQTASAEPTPSVSARDRQHLVFGAGTPQEIEVYKIYGRLDGATVMIIGGIQGDEPGGYMSADLYADLALRRGNLIVVPRTNLKSVIMAHRGPEGDMNRKFEGDLSRDPDQYIIEVLKSLMAESDLVLNLHDGSGYYRPTWESDMANPNRYGQCVIADTDVYVNPETGQTIPLAQYAQEVVDRVNLEITEPLHKFHFFNTNTGASDSKYKEQRKSATYYALTQLGRPAFGIETSKSLPSLEMKIYQHNLAVNAFLDIFGVEVEQPRITLDKPEMGYAVISVNGSLSLAVADGQTLQVAKGDTIEVIHVGANYDRGLSADVLGLGGLNDILRPLAIDRPTSVEFKKDNTRIGRISITLLPEDQSDPTPRLTGSAKVRPPKAPIPVDSDLVAAGAEPTEPVSQVRGVLSRPEQTASPAAPADAPAQVTGFVIEIDGRPMELKPGQEVEVLVGAMVKMVDLVSDGPLPGRVVMNLKGFVPKSKQYKNDGEDRGFTADTGRDMMSAFSVEQKGQIYEINAERGKQILASCAIKLVKPRLATVTVEVDGVSRLIKLGGYINVAPGSQVTVIEVKLAGGHILSNPRFTLGGKNFSADLPQTLIMPSFAVNLAVFNGNMLAGKVMWVPK